VISWSGFFRGLTSGPVPIAWLVMSALTLVLFILLLRYGDFELLPLGAALAMLLVVPHSHPQDWILLAPGAAFLLRRRDSATQRRCCSRAAGRHPLGPRRLGGADQQQDIYWPAPLAFLLLAGYASSPARPPLANARPAARRPSAA
jgi:hypothetical protein